MGGVNAASELVVIHIWIDFLHTALAWQEKDTFKTGTSFISMKE